MIYHLQKAGRKLRRKPTFVSNFHFVPFFGATKVSNLNFRLTRPKSRLGLLLGSSLLALSACAPQSPPISSATRAMPLSFELPPMKQFAAAPRLPMPALANADLVQDFLDLSFQLESGRPLPMLSRFEGPIGVRMIGSTSAVAQRDLQQLLARLRTEAGLPITFTQSADARIVIESISRARIQSAISGAACFVVPNVRNWAEFQRARQTGGLDWATLRSRTTATVFIPADAPPQEIRDCLHEELAQALGPLNDLYRLENSVFNDDNIHSILTPYDMLMLRAYYHPALSNGMSREAVARRLPAIFGQLNPAGAATSPNSGTHIDPRWKDAISDVISSSLSYQHRQNAAETAIRLANSSNLPQQSRAFSYYAYGQLKMARDAGVAYGAFRAADQLYRTTPNTALHSAHTSVQLAAFALSAGEAATTLRLTDAAIPVAYAHQNAAILATLMLLRAEALDLAGRAEDAAEQRLDSLGWARYGFGSDETVRRKLAEIAALNPAI
ncbi:MAG: DUF2927 domain-containing protein [Marivivens sp.]|nr:DUF2927 domain-containing protein [Marivivens sp.]